jgi:hypothetical protein
MTQSVNNGFNASWRHFELARIRPRPIEAVRHLENGCNANLQAPVSAGNGVLVVGGFHIEGDKL